MSSCRKCGLESAEFRKQSRVCRACDVAAARERRAAKALPEFEITVDEPPPERPTVPHFVRAETPPGPLGEVRRVLFIPDTHVPYHDKAKFALMLRAANAFGPQIVVTLGDFADFYAVSNHSKNPRRVSVLDWELEQVRKALALVSTIPTLELKIFVCGNHEDRYDRYIAERAPALHKIGALKDILGTDDLGWQWVPYREHVRVGKVHITHDCGKAGKYAHYDAQAAFEGNAIIGHTHRLGYAVVGNADGKPHVGAMLGWLGDVEQVDYMHRIRALRDWAHGFGVGYMMPDGCVHVVPVPIINNTVIIEGKIIR